MTVQARMKCEINEPAHEGKRVFMRPVTSGPGNESFSKWTPSGELYLYITNPDAFN